MTGAVGARPWDTEWAAEKAADALRYLGRNFPECLENLRALDEHEEAAHRAAMAGDRDTLTWTLSEAIAELVETRPWRYVGVRHDAPPGEPRAGLRPIPHGASPVERGCGPFGKKPRRSPQFRFGHILTGLRAAGENAAEMGHNGQVQTNVPSRATDYRTAGFWFPCRRALPRGRRKPGAGRCCSTSRQETPSPLQNLPTVSPNALETARPVKGAS